jgi:cytochrome c553
VSVGPGGGAVAPALLFFSLVLYLAARALKARQPNWSALSVAVITSFVCAATSGDLYAAGDVKVGREKALMCQACHGTDGLSKVPDAPNIAAQIEPYLAAQLKAFKSGARSNESMSVVARTLSDKDIDDLAAYFSSIEIKIVKVPGE